MRVLDLAADFILDETYAISCEPWDSVEDMEHWPPSWEGLEWRRMETWEEYWHKRAEEATGGYAGPIDLRVFG